MASFQNDISLSLRSMYNTLNNEVLTSASNFRTRFAGFSVYSVVPTAALLF